MEMTYENGSSSSTDSVFSGFGSSSGLNTPVGSDLESSESEEDDFMAELTRQIAENMLLEDDHKPSPVSHTTTDQHQAAVKKVDYQQQQPRNKEYGYGHVKRYPGFMSAAQVGSGMRLVFLGGTGSKNGTGVFLPTNNIGPTDNHHYRKKPVCSTVLIPERVLQTLKQHHEKRSNAQTHGWFGLHTQTINERLHSKDNNNQELQLPQEWTY